jgi:hypothetical protein
MTARRQFERPRRRPPLPTLGFLRPLQRRADEEALWRERLREVPSLRREYRSGLLLQLLVLGALLLACLVLFVQSVGLISQVQKIATLSRFAWFLPALVAGLGLLALRRFMRVFAEYRRFRRD